MPTSTMTAADYRNEYVRTARQARAELTPVAFDAVSTLQPMALTEDYWKSGLRVMVMGQETRHNYRALSSSWADDDSAANDLFDEEMARATDFDFAYGKEQEDSLFWVAFQEVCDRFGLESRRCCAFTNVYKVQLLSQYKGRKGLSPSTLGSVDAMSVVRWERRLLRAEIAYAAPDVLVMFTGHLGWVAAENFNSDEQRRRGARAHFIPLEGGGSNAGRLVSSFLSGIVNGQTSHPCAIRSAEELAAERALLLDRLRAETDRKGLASGEGRRP